VRLYGVFSVGFVGCDYMVCVVLDVLGVTVCGVYCWMCWVCLYGACSVGCVGFDFMVCVVLDVLGATVWCV